MLNWILHPFNVEMQKFKEGMEHVITFLFGSHIKSAYMTSVFSNREQWNSICFVLTHVASVVYRCQEVVDACNAMGDDTPIEFIHDVGAGGLSNALPELVWSIKYIIYVYMYMYYIDVELCFK